GQSSAVANVFFGADSRATAMRSLIWASPWVQAPRRSRRAFPRLDRCDRSLELAALPLRKHLDEEHDDGPRPQRKPKRVDEISDESQRLVRGRQLGHVSPN